MNDTVPSYFGVIVPKPTSVDEANTTLATAKTKEQALIAYKALSLAADRQAMRLEQELNTDQTEGYALISRLIDTRNQLTMAAQYLAEKGTSNGTYRAINALNQACENITLAIESL